MEGSSIGVNSILKGRPVLMIKGIRKSLTLKWTIFCVLLATIPITIAGFNIIQIYQRDLKESVIKIEKEKAQVIVERTEAFFEKMTEHLLFLAMDKQLRRFGLSHAKEHLENFINQSDYFFELTFLDEKGREYVKVSKYKVVNPSDLRDESKSEMFKVASKGQIFYKDFVTTESIFPIMVVAVPVGKYAGKPVGVLSAKVHIRYLLNLIPQRLMEEKSSAYLVGKGGFLLAYPDTSVILLGPFVDRAIAGEEGSLELENLRGERFLVVYKPIRKLGWVIVVQVPVEEVYKPLKQISNTAIQWILISLVIAIILSLFLTRRLTHPITRLSIQMKKVSEGNLDVAIAPDTRDEVGLLTESFNQMIQDLKQSQEALKEAESKFRTIFENLKDVVFITSADGKFIDVNQAGVEVFGYASKEELMSTLVRDLYLNAEDRKRYQNEIAKEAFIRDFEVKLRRKDGTPIDCLITATVKRDEEGQIIGYEGIIKNITIRKRMEEELVQSTKELQALYDLSKLINQSLDLNEVLSTALDKVMELTGFEMGGIYLLQEEEVFEFKYHRGFGPRFVENVRFLKFGEGICGKAVELRQPVSLSIEEYPTPHILPFLREEGIQSLISIPLLAKEKPIGAINLASRSPHFLAPKEINLLGSLGNQIGLALENAKLFSDVAKGKSEWEKTFDAVTDLLTVRDKDFRILRANKAAFKRFGMQPEEMIGKKCYESLHHREIPCEGCYISETLKTKKPVSGERESKYLNGTFRYFTFPVYDETGEITAIVDLAKEITEEKRLQIEKEVINNINKILASSLDVREVMKAVHSELKRVLDSERMTIALLDEARKGFRYFALEKDYDTQELMSGVVYPKEGTSFEKVVDTGLPIIVPDTAKSDFWIHQKLLKEGIHSSLVFPLGYKGKLIGTMSFGSKEMGHFSEKHIHFLNQIGTGLAISIQNTLLFEETKRRLDELTILYEITKMSTSSFNLDRMLTEIVNSLNNVFKFEAFGILLVDEMTRKLVPHASYKGLSIENIEKLGLCLGKGITGWVAEKGEPLLVNNVKEDPRYISNGEAILSEMCVPLKVGMKVIGVIDAQSRELNAFSENDLRLLNIASGQIATAIENIRLHEEIKQSEERYRTVVESAHDGVCVIGRDFRFKYVNKRITGIHGYAQEELVGMDFRQFLDEESSKLVDDRFVRWRRGERLSSLFELKIFRKDGEIRNVEISARAIKDSKGNVNFVCFVKDITEKRKMEDQLIQNEKLRALGEMASGVAHDFNNALAAILGNTQLLLYNVRDEEIKESLQIIEKVARDSAQTVRRLQDFTRRRIHQELFKLDVNSVIKDAIEITKPKWKDEVQGRGIYIDMVTNFEKVPPVLGNGSEMREVIANMIFNAIEAMPEGGKIEIQTFQRREKVYVKISDTGIGMSEEVRKKIFEPFFTTKPFSNTGLGLSMSYGIVKRFGGEIEVESRVGKGTTFTVLLPIKLEGEEESIPPSLIGKGREARILVIDDEETVRSVLSRILFQNNHQVTVAEDGEEGIRLFKEKEFDMVLTDLGMPGMSGWEVCRTIKRISPHTPVGMITGRGAEVDQAKMEESGIDFVIPKPFQFDQILKVVDDTIASREKPLIT